MGRGLRPWKSLAWLPQGGRTRNRAGVPGTRPWALNCTLCRGMSGTPGRKRSEEASLELTCVAVSPARVCGCVCVCARARARDRHPGIGYRIGEWACTTVVLCVRVCVSVSCLWLWGCGSSALTVFLTACLTWVEMCFCDNIIVCGPFVQDCGVRQCCDRLFGSACLTWGCLCVLLGFACDCEVLWQCFCNTMFVIACFLELVLACVFWLSDWMTVKRVNVLLWKVVWGCVCLQQGACMCLSDVYVRCRIGFSD